MLNVCGAPGYVSAYYQEQIKFRNFSFQKNKKKETLKITKPNPLLWKIILLNIIIWHIIQIGNTSMYNFTYRDFPNVQHFSLKLKQHY